MRNLYIIKLIKKKIKTIKFFDTIKLIKKKYKDNQIFLHYKINKKRYFYWTIKIYTMYIWKSSHYKMSYRCRWTRG